MFPGLSGSLNGGLESGLEGGLECYGNQLQKMWGIFRGVADLSGHSSAVEPETQPVSQAVDQLVAPSADWKSPQHTPHHTA